MNKRLVSSISLLLLATPFCYAKGYTLTEANSIIVVLIIIVIALIAFVGYSLYHNRVISQRNEQLRRILTALDDYRAMVGSGVLAQASDQGRALSLDEQEEVLKKKLSKPKEAKVAQKDDEQNFFVKMDARVNKEKPFTDPDFDHDALVKFKTELMTDDRPETAAFYASLGFEPAERLGCRAWMRIYRE